MGTQSRTGAGAARAGAHGLEGFPPPVGCFRRGVVGRRPRCKPEADGGGLIVRLGSLRSKSASQGHAMGRRTCPAVPHATRRAVL